jgi:molybdenum cofactor cytidylyltransferase
MTFGEVETATAAGTILAHSVTIGDVRWTKGRVLDAADVAAALAAGVTALTVARPGPGDIAENDAAAALAAAFAGPGTTPAAAAHGRANLITAAAGLAGVDAAAVDAVNAVDERLTIGTLAPLARVAAGEVVATIKIIPYAVPAAVLAAAVAAAAPIIVSAFAARRFVLIQSRLAGTPDKLLARTEAVTRDRVVALGGTLAPAVECHHDTAALAAAIAAADPGAVVLIAGASATADRRDVIPAAIVAAGGTVERMGMPVDPGNLLCLGTHAGRAVIGLPGCARSPKRNGFDWVLERLAAGLPVDGRAIAAMGVGGLLPEAERPQPRVVTARAVVGAVVLAAGRSTRMGAANKLLADLGGKPVVVHVVEAIAAAGLPPPVVVVGHRAAEVAAALAGRPATIVTAADFADGMSRSLRAGLAAAPAAWGAAIIALGDMPAVDPATYAALAAAARDRIAVAVPTWHGRRGNPVVWGRAHWPRLMALTGDGGGRGVLGDLGDRVVEVAVDDPGILADVDTPEALAALRARIAG